MRSSLPMHVLAGRVHRTIERHGLCPPGSRVLAAVSGGADSTALVHLLRELAPLLGIQLAGLAHFNHRLRGVAADADEEFCRQLAGALSLPFEAGTDDVAVAARDMGTSLEDAGRRLRYSFLESAADTLGATHVALGHTRDDQAETLLLNLLRGAGTRGLGGMRARRGRFIRPLLECTHDELTGWLAGRGLPHREDESNLDPRFLRNRVRHEVMPLLAGLAPSVGATLARAARIAQDEGDYLDQVAGQEFERLADTSKGEVALSAAGLAGLPVAVGRRVAFLALGNIAGGRYVGFDQVDRLLTLAAGPGGKGALACPGGRAAREGDRLVLRAGRRTTAGNQPGVNSFRAALSIPGEASIGDGREVSCSLRLETVTELLAGQRRLADERQAIVDADLVSGLAVRFRRPGDRLRPLGLGGTRKLQDLFVDRRVPREDRDRTPLVVDADDRIVWVAGHGIAEDFRVSDRTRAVVILELRGERA